MDGRILALLEQMVEGRNDFLHSDTVNSIHVDHRHTILSQYVANELLLLTMINQLSSPAQYYTLTLPPSFLNPVPVLATPEQIAGCLIDGTTTSSCAVCQEAISTGGCQIRQCSHFFHRSCIESWFSLSVRCPVCRHDIREEHQSNQTSLASSQTPFQQGGQ